MEKTKLLLWINAILFMLFGIGFVLAPSPLAQWITNSAPGTSSGMIDLRATYGGLALGIGVFWAICASNGSERNGLLSTILVLSVVALGRIIGILLDGTPNTFILLLLTAEIIFAILNFMAYKNQEATNAS